MKHSILKRAGTLLLSTATGLCGFAEGVGFGQDSAMDSAETQSRFAQLLNRESKPTPGRPPSAIPIVPLGITAPVTGDLPLVTSAWPVQVHPSPLQNAARWPNADPAPPVPAITPGPSSHPLLSPAAEQTTVAPPRVSHPLAESKSPAEAEADSGGPHHPLADVSVPSDATFEMPVAGKPQEAGDAKKTETVLTPPIELHEISDDLEAAWAHQVQQELTNPMSQVTPVSVPLAPPAVSESENPFHGFAMPSQPVIERASASLEATEDSSAPHPVTESAVARDETPAPAKTALPEVVIQPAARKPTRAPRTKADVTPANDQAASQRVGLDGCCPVTLRDNRIQVPGRAEHESQWQGVTYRLVSAEAKQTFDVHPDHYAPAQGGVDVTLTSHKGQEIPGSLEHAIWYKRRLYLFHDAQSLKTFTANPAKYVK